MSFLRMRQICLVAHELEPVVADLCAILGLQVCHRDPGGTLLEINHSPGNADLHGPYWPAGPHWQDASGGSQAIAMTAVTLRAAAPQTVAAKWAEVLGRVLSRSAGAGSLVSEIRLDNASRMAFATLAAHALPRLSELEIQVRDAASVCATARLRGCETQPGAVRIGGVWWRLLAPATVVPASR